MRSARSHSRGFTLLETVISIGVLAVLLSAFLAVFGPATIGIRRAIGTQEADRLTSTLLTELDTLRSGQTGTSGFDKAFTWIQDSSNANSTLFVYQYRANPTSGPRADGTLAPFSGSGVAGRDFILQPMLRQRSDTLLAADLAALEGRVFAVKLVQLVYNNGSMQPGTAGTIADPISGTQASNSAAYPGGSLAFTAEFFDVPSTSPAYLQQGGAFNLTKLKNPLFTRNVAVNR